MYVEEEGPGDLMTWVGNVGYHKETASIHLGV